MVEYSIYSYSPGRTRTFDRLLKRQLLYQLSYGRFIQLNSDGEKYLAIIPLLDKFRTPDWVKIKREVEVFGFVIK